MAKELHLPSNPFLGGLIGYGALFHDIPASHLNELLPDECALKKLADPLFLPHWWDCRHGDTLANRVVSNTKPWRGLVASYGRQHELDFDLLGAKGLHTCLLQSASGPRYISPWEAASALGLPNTIRLPADLHLCWQLVGNGITVAHSVLQLSRLHILCASISPFASEHVPSLVHLCRAMQRLGLQLADATPISEGGHRVLVSKSESPHGNGVGEVGSIVELPPQETTHVGGNDDIVVIHPNPPFNQEFLRPSKWLKTHGFAEISPTLPYEIKPEEEKPCPKIGVQFLPAPSLQELLEECRKAQATLCKTVHGDLLKVVIFASMISRWTVVTWAPHGKTVTKLFQLVLPHFCPSLVKKVVDYDTETELDVIPYANPHRILRFCPVDVLCQIQLTCVRNQKIIQPATLTTRVSDWITEFAARLNVPSHMLELHSNDKVVPRDVFILAIGSKFFSLHWVVPFHFPVVIPDTDDSQRPMDLRVSSNQEQSGEITGAPKNVEGLLCFAAKHPLWKSIRVVTRSSHASVAEVVGGLFPDLVRNSKPVIEVGGIIFSADTKVSDIPSHHEFQLELNGDRPLPCITIYRVPAQVGLCLFPSKLEIGDTPFQRWIRTPFKIQAIQVELPGFLTLLELGSSFFAQTTNAQTIQVTMNGKLVDPSLLIKETPINDTIAFKVCALPGGAKHELATIITQALKNRGVPDEALDARTKSILATVPQEQIRTHIKEPEVTFWASLKKLASEHGIRLVTASELKAFQKDQRTQKRSTPVSEPPTKGKGKGTKGAKGKGSKPEDPLQKLDLACVQLQTKYLKAEGFDSIQVLQKADFGVDKQGVTLMTEREAEAFFPVKPLSTGPLAILALHECSSSSSDLVMLPAINKAGEPILLPIVIHNFGDIIVHYHPGPVSANTPEVATQVIEVTIRRSLVEDWAKVRDGLQYLAVHNPVLKGGVVIAHWSFKSYGNNKKPAPFDQATYVHGYIRCKNECVEVLKMSGKNGVFFIPRDDSHRPDPAFAIIPSSDKLEHMLIQAQKHVTTLGIIEVKSGFAYRTRRENLQSLRKTLMPNSVWSEEGQPRVGDEMFILKHVAVATGAPQLTSALKELGWDAVGIRQIGQSTWSVAASQPPPSPHLLINGQFTIAVPAHDNSKKSSGQFRTLASFAPGSAVSAVPTTAPDEEMATNSNHQSRFNELKCDLNEQIDQLVEKKMQETREQVGVLTEAISAQESKIDRIESAVTKVQGDVQDQNLHVETRLASIEHSVTSQGNSMLAQMNGMLQTFQNTLMSRLDAIEGGDHKRPRKDGQ